MGQVRQNNPTGKSFLIFGICVKPQNQKYSASVVGQISSMNLPVSSLHEGRIAIVTDVGWDAVDADVPITNGADAYGEVVWS